MGHTTRNKILHTQYTVLVHHEIMGFVMEDKPSELSCTVLTHNIMCEHSTWSLNNNYVISLYLSLLSVLRVRILHALLPG